MGLFSGLKHNTHDYNIGDIPVSFGEGFAQTFSDAVGATSGDLLQAARNKFDDSPLIDFQQARHLAEKEGVSVTVPSTGIRQDTLTALIKRKHEQAATASVMSRAPGGFMAQAGYFTAGLAGGLLDPLEFGSNFVPVVGQARKAKMLADAGAGVFSRMGARAQIGMAEGAAGSVLLEPFVYGSKTYLQDDYTSWDSMLNIGLGTVVGGGLHAVGGAGVDAWRKYRATPDVNTAPPPGAEPVAQAYGADTQIKIGDQYEPAKWALVDASVVEATMGKADNQFRDRTRVASDAQVNDIANKIDFAMLSDSPVMDYGAPTLSLDGRVVGGNGRLAAISRAYDIGKGADYSGPLAAKLAELGIDPAALEGMSKPALVRVLQGDVDVRQAAILSNEGGAMKMSALEQAKVDAERLGDMRLEMGENGDLNNAANRAAIRKWVESQPVNQRNALMDADGMLSAEGLQRLRNSVLFKAYGDSPTLARLIEAVDPGSRNVANALMRSSGAVADAEARIRAGELHPVSLADDIRLAVEKYAQIKQDGATVRDYLDQLDAFGDGMTPESRSLLAFMGENIASPRRMAEAVQGFYRQLDEAGNPGQGDMFGGSGAPDKAAMLARAIDEAGNVETSAAELAATVSPQTREAALNTAVAQSVAGIEVDVDAMVRADPAIGQAGETEIRNAANRAQKPEADALADFAASEAVQERVDLAPKSRGLAEAEEAAAEAAALLSDVMKAGDQAFKYSRGEAPGQKKATLWHATTARFPADERGVHGGFRWDKINSDAGEGAQAFGYGHYLSQGPWISQSQYRERLIKMKASNSSFEIPDGAGGVITLSKDSDAAWQLPDGTIVHASQKDARLAALADAIAQVDGYGYARAKLAFDAIAKIPGAGGEDGRLALAALDEVTTAVKTDTLERKGGSWYTSWRDSRGLNVEVFATEEQARAFVPRVLDQGIKKYEPAVPDNFRERVLAGDKEITGPLADFLLKSAPKKRGVSHTVGKDLKQLPFNVEGANVTVNPLDLIDGTKFDDELQALSDSGVDTITIERPGSLYEAKMPSEVFGKMMMWNDPLSAQPEKVQAAFKAWGISGQQDLFWDVGSSVDWFTTNASFRVEQRTDGYHLFSSGSDLGTFATLGDAKSAALQRSEISGGKAYSELVAMIDSDPDRLGPDFEMAVMDAAMRRGMDPETVDDSLFGSDEIASIMLDNAGVPGHMFLAEGGTGGASGNVYNAVVYSDDVTELVNRYARQTGDVVNAASDSVGLTEALRLSFGKSTDALISAGGVKIVSTPDDLPARSDGAKHPGDVKGWAHPDGTAYIVASNVSEKQARGMLLHEVGVHIGMEQMLGADVFQSVLKELDDAIMRGEDWAQAARDRVPADTAVGLVREEQLAYLVENAPELPIVQRIIAAVRAWAYRTFEFARERMTLGEADFRAMAVAALHHAARGEGAGVLAGAYARAQTATAAFKNWFGDSKVVDANGKPLVVYHGTPFDFDVFGGKPVDYVRGFFFSDTPGATPAAMGPGTQIMPVYLSIKKPRVVSSDVLGDVQREYEELKRAKQFGYDGLMGKTEYGETIYVAMHPEQIKSATGNNGQFDPTNPDIRFSRTLPDTITVGAKKMYHGSPSDRIGEFAPDKNGLIFVSPDPEVADSYAKAIKRSKDFANHKPTVYEVEVDAKNTLDFDNLPPYTGEAWQDALGNALNYPENGGAFNSEDKRATWADIEEFGGKDLFDAIKTAGFDSVAVTNPGINGREREMAVFDDRQIKIAGKNSANPDIRYSRGETPDPTDADAPVKKADEQVKRAKDFGKALRAAADKLDNDAAATAAMRASMPDITATEIDELLGQLRKQVKGLRGSARSMRAQVTAADTANDLQTDAMKAADTLANNIEMDSTIEKRNVALNIAARLRASSFLGQFFGHGKLDVEGFRALLVGSERKRTGGRLSVDAEQKGYRGEWMGGLTADMRKADVWDLFVGGTMDREASQALFLMGDKNADLSGLPKEAVEIARVIEKYQTDARETRNRFGAWIRDAKGYIVRQAHDMIKIREAGAEAWVAYVMPRLDLDKMIEYGLISDKDVTGSLQAMWSDFAAGRHMSVSLDPEQSAALKGSSLARRESASRTLFFKDGYSFHEYNTKFGQGRLAEAVVSGLDNAAKAAGLLKVLGTNPEAMIKSLADEYEASLTGDPERRAKFAQSRGEIDNMIKTIDGRINIPGSYMGARISAGARAVQSMAKLGVALISSITDPLIYAADLRSVRGTNLLSGMMEAISGLATGSGTKDQKAILSQLGVFSESMTGGVFARFDSPDMIGGKMSAAMQLFFKVNGLTWWTETLRNSYALSHSHYLAEQSGKGFDKLDAGTADMLRLYNIDAGKWDILRMAGLQMADGRKYMTPEGLATVPRAAFENYITNVGRTVSDASVANLRDDLGQALRTMTIDRMHHAVIEPGARTRAFMTRGTQPGTVPGEALRFIGQFKSFPVAFMQMAIGREIYGKGYDTMGDYLKNGKGDMLGLASFIGMTIGMGYIAMSVKDMIKGKNPRPVDDWRTWAAAAVQGGGLGLYGDFLFGKFSRTGGTLSASMGGPVIGAADTVADLWTKIRSGDDAAASAFQAVLSNTPFMNLFYTRIALDYLIIYQIQEALNPGFLRRMEGRVQREHGQTYMFPPSQYANR